MLTFETCVNFSDLWIQQLTHFHPKGNSNVSGSQYTERVIWEWTSSNPYRKISKWVETFLVHIQFCSWIFFTLLSHAYFVPFSFYFAWFSDGSIQIYHNNAPLVTAFDRRPAPTRYISFATDQPSGMSFFYDCLPHNSDTVNQKKVVSAQIFSVHSSVNRIVSQVYIIICTITVLYICSNT